MNAKNKQIIESILHRCKQYDVKVDAILSHYADKMKETETQVRHYKEEYAKTVIAEQQKKLVSDARRLLEAEYEEFVSDTRRDAEELRSQLMVHFMRPCKDTFIQQLQIIKDFGIKPSRIQLEVLIEMNNGNSLGLQSLAAVLETNKSDYAIKFTAMEQYENDLETIERLCRNADHFVPHDQHSAGCAVYRGQPITYYRTDGSTYENGATWDSISLISCNAAMNSAVSEIEAMRDRWAADVSTEIMDRASAEFAKERAQESADMGLKLPEEPDPVSSTSIEPSKNHVIEIAKSIGRETAAGKAAAAAIKDSGHIK